MPGRDAEAIAVGQGADRGRAKDRALLLEATDEPVGDAGDLFAAKHADEMVDLGSVFEQLLFLPLGQTAGNNHAPRAPSLLQVEHFIDGRKRLSSCPLDEAAGVDDDKIGPIRLADQLIAVELEQT